MINAWLRFQRPRFRKTKGYPAQIQRAIDMHGYKAVMLAVRRYWLYDRTRPLLTRALNMVRTLTASDMSYETYKARQHRLGRPRKRSVTSTEYEQLLRRAE